MFTDALGPGDRQRRGLGLQLPAAPRCWGAFHSGPRRNESTLLCLAEVSGTRRRGDQETVGQMAVQDVIYNSHVASREALHGGEAWWSHTEAFLWGLEREVGSCNPGTAVDGDGLILSPDSFILKNDQPERCSILELSRVRAPSWAALCQLGSLPCAYPVLSTAFLFFGCMPRFI